MVYLRLTAIVGTIKTVGPGLLHILAMLGHWLLLLNSQLLEENISAVEYGRGCTGSGPLHTAEAGQLRGVNIGRSLCALMLRVNIAAELRLGDAGPPQISINLPPDLIASVVNRHLIGLLAFEMDVTDIDFPNVGLGAVGGIRLLLLGSRCLVGDLVTNSVELLEVLPRGRIGAVALALEGTVLAKKAVERLYAHANLPGQARLGDDACIKSAVDFTTHLVTVVAHRRINDNILEFVGCW